mmetsp:Transcript_43183/g.41516  ORF Transcript_43183/g.41516 Transcript_43183/m.41516 type:complete len:95 (-) Transcript_43183:25-309(-)
MEWLLLLLVHFGPTVAHFLHDLLGRPFGVLALQLLPLNLAKVDVGRERLLRLSHLNFDLLLFFDPFKRYKRREINFSSRALDALSFILMCRVLF